MTGKEMSVEKVEAEVLQDRPFYEFSSGGVTLSGREPLLQHAFTLAVLARCKEDGLQGDIDVS